MAGESQKMEAPPLYTEMRRSKFVWRSVLIFNLALGAYIFSRPVKKDTRGKEIIDTSKDMTVPPMTSAPAETTTLDFDDVIFFPTEPEKARNTKRRIAAGKEKHKRDIGREEKD